LKTRARTTNLFVRLIEDGLLVSAGFLVVLLAIYRINEPTALDPIQFKFTVINASLSLALAAAGLALVVLVGGLDMSSAGIIALANAILTSYFPENLVPQLLLLLLVIGIGVAIGILNGFIVHRFDLEPVVVTLATGFVMSGIALLVLPAPAGLPEVKGFSLIAFVTSDMMQVPVGGMILVAIGIGWIFLRRSRLGSNLIAIGSDKESAAYTGINVRKTTLFAFGTAGGLYALAGIAVTSQTSGGDPQLGAGFLLGSFAAVVIGGLRLGGGRGSLIGAIMGALAVTVSINVLFVMGFATYWTYIARGALLLSAIAVQAMAMVLIRRNRKAVKPVEFVKDMS